MAGGGILDAPAVKSSGFSKFPANSYIFFPAAHTVRPYKGLGP